MYTVGEIFIDFLSIFLSSNKRSSQLGSIHTAPPTLGDVQPDATSITSSYQIGGSIESVSSRSGLFQEHFEVKTTEKVEGGSRDVITSESKEVDTSTSETKVSASECAYVQGIASSTPTTTQVEVKSDVVAVEYLKSGTQVPVSTEDLESEIEKSTMLKSAVDEGNVAKEAKELSDAEKESVLSTKMVSGAKEVLPEKTVKKTVKKTVASRFQVSKEEKQASSLMKEEKVSSKSKFQGLISKALHTGESRSPAAASVKPTLERIPEVSSSTLDVPPDSEAMSTGRGHGSIPEKETGKSPLTRKGRG